MAYEARYKAIEAMYEELEQLTKATMRKRVEITVSTQRLDDLQKGILQISDHLPLIPELEALDDGNYIEHDNKLYAVAKTDEATTITITSASVFPESMPLRDFQESDYKHTQKIHHDLVKLDLSVKDYGLAWQQRLDELYEKEGIKKV